MSADQIHCKLRAADGCHRAVGAWYDLQHQRRQHTVHSHGRGRPHHTQRVGVRKALPALGVRWLAGAGQPAQTHDVSHCHERHHVQPKDGFYTLGPRSMLELSLHLTNAYGDLVAKCGLCNTPAILVCTAITTATHMDRLPWQGDRCSNVGCPAKFHWRCLLRYHRHARANDIVAKHQATLQ